MYAIHWRSLVTGQRGHGEPVFGTQESAQSVADSWDKKWPDLTHWIEADEEDADPAADRGDWEFHRDHDQ